MYCFKIVSAGQSLRSRCYQGCFILTDAQNPLSLACRWLSPPSVSSHCAPSVHVCLQVKIYEMDWLLTLKFIHCNSNPDTVIFVDRTYRRQLGHVSVVWDGISAFYNKRPQNNFLVVFLSCESGKSTDHSLDVGPHQNLHMLVPWFWTLKNNFLLLISHTGYRTLSAQP